MKPALAWTLLALVLGMALTWMLGRSTGPYAAAPLRPGGARADAHERSTRAAVSPRVVDPSRKSPLVPAAARNWPEGWLPLSGSLRVRDADGSEHDAEDGRFKLVLWEGARGVTQAVEVTAGRFETRTPPAGLLSARDLTLGGQRAHFDSLPRRFPVPDSGFLELEAHWREVFTLAVVDAGTGAALDDLLVVRTPQLGWIHPGAIEPERVIATAASSPLRIVPWSDFLSGVLVQSPGYAWGSARLDPNTPPRSELLLVRGADLRVRLTGAPTPPDSWLRLRPADGSNVLVELHASAKTELVLDALPARTYSASIELGSGTNPVFLAREIFDLEAGTTVELSLELEPPAPLARAALSGSVSVPASWDLEHFVLTIRASASTRRLAESSREIHSENMLAREADPETRTWEGVELEVGSYTLSVHPVGYSETIELSADGLETSLRVPEPGRVLLTAVDSVDGEPVELTRIEWRVAEGAGPTIVVDANENGRFRFRAPQTPITVSAFLKGYACEPMTIDVTETTEATLELRPAGGAVIVLRDGERIVPWERSWKIRVTPLEGKGTWEGVRLVEAGCSVEVSARGRYRVVLPEIDGFEPSEPLELEIAPGVTAEHVVELARLPGEDE